MINDKNINERTCIRVIVPPDAGPGRELIVQTPEGRLVSAIVPKGHQAGSIFLVNCPPPPPRSALQQQKHNQQQNQNHTRMKENGKMMMDSSMSQGQNYNQQVQPPSSLLKIKVPKGKRKGDRFKVRMADGQTIEATVPNNNITEFYLDVNANDVAKRKRKQNWHDNPLAVLPMTFGPFL